jgi:hypothetical protein
MRQKPIGNTPEVIIFSKGDYGGLKKISHRRGFVGRRYNGSLLIAHGSPKNKAHAGKGSTSLGGRDDEGSFLSAAGWGGFHNGGLIKGHVAVLPAEFIYMPLVADAFIYHHDDPLHQSPVAGVRQYCDQGFSRFRGPIKIHTVFVHYLPHFISSRNFIMHIIVDKQLNYYKKFFAAPTGPKNQRVDSWRINCKIIYYG